MNYTITNCVIPLYFTQVIGDAINSNLSGFDLTDIQTAAQDNYDNLNDSMVNLYLDITVYAETKDE